MKKTIFLFAAIVCLAANNACTNANKNASDQQETAISFEAATPGIPAVLNVQGACEMCKERIEQAAKGVEGVTAASWDADAKQLLFTYDTEKTSCEVVSKAIAVAGYDTELDKADDETYNALPPCCQYRG
jgi:Cu(I)/Ag(I) efflux system membrane fusion protein